MCEKKLEKVFKSVTSHSHWHIGIHSCQMQASFFITMQWTEITNGSGTGSVQRTFAKFFNEVQINRIYFNKGKGVCSTFKESIVLHCDQRLTGLQTGFWRGKSFVSHRKTADSSIILYLFLSGTKIKLTYSVTVDWKCGILGQTSIVV